MAKVHIDVIWLIAKPLVGMLWKILIIYKKKVLEKWTADLGLSRWAFGTQFIFIRFLKVTLIESKD